MRTVLYILTVLGVVALAFWAYRENYATQQTLNDAGDLRRDIQAAHSRLSVLNAEWAYLNRPDRLRDLADVNFDRLGLQSLAPEQFGVIDQVAYPSEADMPVLNPVEVSSDEQAGDRP